MTYLRVAKAVELEGRAKTLYRFFEIFPGLFAWATLCAAVLGSWLFPVQTAFFVIAFVVFWLFRNIYLAFHLRAGYKKMREHEKVNWKEKIEHLSLQNSKVPVSSFKEVYQLVVLPTYKEPFEVLQGTIQGLAKTDYPRENIIVVVAFEERAGTEAHDSAEKLTQEFQGTFFKFITTFHPADIPGELAGKGANETWALQHVNITSFGLQPEQVLVSSFDADTVVYEKYFSCLTYHYLTSVSPFRHSYQPIPLFFNNIWQAPALSRLFAFATTFWALMNQQRPEKLITFSSHSMSYIALQEVGFKQTNVVSDDSRIFWQCLLHYNGDYAVQPLFYPVAMDANVAQSVVQTAKNIYKQQLRWAYGVENIPYFLFGFLQNKKIPVKRKFALGFEAIEGFWSWATASILIFLLGWLPLVLGGEEFSRTLLSYNLPRTTTAILTISLLGIVGSIYLSLLLLPIRPKTGKASKPLFFVLQWIAVPALMIFFSLPALEAQTRLLLGKYMGFWVTPKLRNSSKPTILNEDAL